MRPSFIHINQILFAATVEAVAPFTSPLSPLPLSTFPHDASKETCNAEAEYSAEYKELYFRNDYPRITFKCGLLYFLVNKAQPKAFWWRFGPGETMLLVGAVLPSLNATWRHPIGQNPILPSNDFKVSSLSEQNIREKEELLLLRTQFSPLKKDASCKASLV